MYSGDLGLICVPLVYILATLDITMECFGGILVLTLEDFGVRLARLLGPLGGGWGVRWVYVISRIGLREFT